MLKLLSSGLALILLCTFTAWYLSSKFCAPDVLGAIPDVSGIDAKIATTGANTAIAGAAGSLPHFSYSDSRINIPDAEGFGFEKSSDKLIAGNGADIYWQEMANSLAQNKGKKLYVQGSYTGSENNPTRFGNLGIARAEAIKQKLITMGAPAAAVITSGTKTEGAFFAGNIYVGGINFLSQAPALEQTAKVENVKDGRVKGILMQPLNLYFATSAKDIKMTSEIKSYFDELKIYLSKNPTAKVSVLGFTDNQGDSLKNITLSENRAEMVKDFMISKKFDTARLVVMGKGALRPIGNNETLEGRAQNRRVEVRLVYN